MAERAVLAHLGKLEDERQVFHEDNRWHAR
jgi:hypothetical protein